MQEITVVDQGAPQRPHHHAKRRRAGAGRSGQRGDRRIVHARASRDHRDRDQRGSEARSHRRKHPARPVTVGHPGAERGHEHDRQAEQRHHEPGESVAAAADGQRENQGRETIP
jgi:hypothetical protein